MKNQLFQLDPPTVSAVPETSGVLQLLDSTNEVVYIVGVPNIRQALIEQLQSPGTACFFQIEETFMYTMRESELLRTHLRRHGKMPEGNTLGDDLF